MKNKKQGLKQSETKTKNKNKTRKEKNLYITAEFFLSFFYIGLFTYTQTNFWSSFLQMGSSNNIIGCRINRAVHSIKV